MDDACKEGGIEECEEDLVEHCMRNFYTGLRIHHESCPSQMCEAAIFWVVYRSVAPALFQKIYLDQIQSCAKLPG